MSKNKVCICVLNFQSNKETLDLLNSLKSLTGDFEVYILENGSSKFSFLKLDIPKGLNYSIAYYSSQKNLGFAGGNNYLLKKAQGLFDYFWLLNNDTLVYSESLNELIKVFKIKKRAGLVGSLLLYPDNKTVWWCGSKVDLKRAKVLKKYFNKNKTEVPRKIFETDEITGTSMLISKEFINQVGLMDESFFHTWEDTEYSLRGEKLGFKCYVSPKSVVIHKVGMSSGSEYSPLHMYYVERGRVLLMKKLGYFTAGSLLYLFPLWTKRILAPLVKKKSLTALISTVTGIMDGINETTGKKNFKS